MAVLDAKAIAKLAHDAGVEDASARAVAVAIALAESGGNTAATHTNTNGSTDTGLWQINSVHRGSHPTWTTAWLKNARNNAAAMATLSQKGATWHDWAAYNSGKYKDHLERAAQGVVLEDSGGASITDIIGYALEFSGVPGGNVLAAGVDAASSVPAALGTIGSALTNAVEILAAAGGWIANPHNWGRVALVVLGAALAVAAAAIVIEPHAKGLGPL